MRLKLFSHNLYLLAGVAFGIWGAIALNFHPSLLVLTLILLLGAVFYAIAFWALRYERKQIGLEAKLRAQTLAEIKRKDKPPTTANTSDA